MYVCCIMSYSEYFFPRIAFSSILGVVPKKRFLVAKHDHNLCLISQFQENVSSFNSLANTLLGVTNAAPMEQWPSG